MLKPTGEVLKKKLDSDGSGNHGSSHHDSSHQSEAPAMMKSEAGSGKAVARETGVLTPRKPRNRPVRPNRSFGESSTPMGSIDRRAMRAREA